MKRKRICTVLFLALLMLIGGCTKKPEEKTGYDLAGKTFYNTVDEYGNTDHSSLWLGKDGSFVLKDNFYEGYYQMIGDWTLNENVLTLEVKESGVGNFSKVLFEAVDDENLQLKTTLAGSKADQIFSVNEIKGSDVSKDPDTPKDTDTGKEEKDPEFTYATFYNISQSSKEKSYCELRSDDSFAFIDRNDLSVSEYNGTFTQEGDLLTLKCPEKTIRFLILSERKLQLQSDVGVSATGDEFSADYLPPQEIHCTGLTSLYNNYWATEGVSGYDLQAKATPENTTDKITYSSDDEKVVKVDENGLCTAVAPGTTKIHIRCGTVERVVGFETKPKKVEVSSVSVTPGTILIYYNNTGKISAKVSPDNATDQTLIYASADPGIAKVDSKGNLTGVSPGITKVTVTASNGKQAVCDVCVEGETVIFSMQNNVSVKAASGEKIPYKATWIMCYDFNYNTQDVTNEVDFHTAYTSALDIDGHGNVYAKGAIYETVDIPVYFSFSDGSSFYVQSQEFTVHVVK